MQSSLPEDPFLYHHKVTNNDLKVFNIFQASSDESVTGTLVVLCIAHSPKSRFENTESGCISDVLARNIIFAQIINLSIINYVTLKMHVSEAALRCPKKINLET